MLECKFDLEVLLKLETLFMIRPLHRTPQRLATNARRSFKRFRVRKAARTSNCFVRVVAACAGRLTVHKEADI